MKKYELCLQSFVDELKNITPKHEAALVNLLRLALKYDDLEEIKQYNFIVQTDEN